jgi:hypothetical protein
MGDFEVQRREVHGGTGVARVGGVTVHGFLAALATASGPLLPGRCGHPKEANHPVLAERAVAVTRAGAQLECAFLLFNMAGAGTRA